jgi:hypothetical protein
MKVRLAGRKEQERMTGAIVELCGDVIFRDIALLYVLTPVQVKRTVRLPNEQKVVISLA